MKYAHTLLGTGHATLTLAAAMVAAPALAEIDLVFEPVTGEVAVGEVLQVRLLAYSDSDEDQLLAAVDMVFGWDPDRLQLLGNHQDGAVTLLSSGFPAGDPWGLNETSPPQNGTGLYVAWGPLGSPVPATPMGTLLTTFEFLALAPGVTVIDILPSGGDPPRNTIIFDGTTPNTDVTGLLIGAAVTVVPACPGDLDNDGVVGVDDLLILLAGWGPCPDPSDSSGDCPADLSGSGDVGVDDLLVLLANWGVCPDD